MTKNIIFIYSSIFLLFGIFINNISKEIFTSLLVLLILVVLFLCYYLKTKKFGILLILSSIFFIIGIIISYTNLENIKNNNKILEKYIGAKQDIIINIIDTNKINENYNQYIGKVIKLGNEEIKDKEIKILVNTKDKLNTGLILKTNAKITDIRNFNGFNYKYYLLSKKIYLKANIYNYESIEKNNQNIVNSYIKIFRSEIIKTIYEIYPKNEAIFLAGILIGARESLPDELKTNFNNSGLTHFIAVSGFNITILIIFLTYLIKKLPKVLRIIVIIISIILFTILVGDTAPVIRASIMGIIGYLIVNYGRKADSLGVLLVTLTLMIIYSPLSINYDVSLHLSFFAVLGIIYTNDFFEKVFKWLPNFLEIRTAFNLTLSALVFTLPIMVSNFGQLSILAPISNILVSWTIPLSMLLGFVSIIVYYVYEKFAIIIGFFTWLLLKWDIMIVNIFGESKWSIIKIDMGDYKYHFQLIYFIIIIFIIIYYRKREQD